MSTTKEATIIGTPDQSSHEAKVPPQRHSSRRQKITAGAIGIGIFISGLAILTGGNGEKESNDQHPRPAASPSVSIPPDAHLDPNGLYVVPDPTPNTDPALKPKFEFTPEWATIGSSAQSIVKAYNNDIFKAYAERNPIYLAYCLENINGQFGQGQARRIGLFKPNDVVEHHYELVSDLGRSGEEWDLIIKSTETVNGATKSETGHFVLVPKILNITDEEYQRAGKVPRDDDRFTSNPEIVWVIREVVDMGEPVPVSP